MFYKNTVSFCELKNGDARAKKTLFMVNLCRNYSGFKVLFAHVKIELDHKEALKHAYNMSHIKLDLNNLNFHQLNPLSSCFGDFFGY